jgi:hypothetical protein
MGIRHILQVSGPKVSGFVYANAVLLGVLLLPVAARADVAGEVSTAATHAGLAAGSGTLPMAQMHLHHVLNCLLGPDGKGYDPTAANPCKAQGSGAIPDTSDVLKKEMLQRAASNAMDALKETDLDAVKKDASNIQTTLKNITY